MNPFRHFIDIASRPFPGAKRSATVAMMVLQGMNCLAAEKGEMVTLESLVAEMSDFDRVARWPSPEFACLQASSHDRATVSPDQPGWFANGDHSNFIRDEVNQGRTERVMLDTEGPGALVRFWLTTVENKKGVLRIYLDHAAEPELVFPAFDLMSSKLDLKEPFAIPHPGYTRDGNGGNTLMLPVPFAKHCKVTWEEKGAGPRYYQINHRTYAKGTPVKTFRSSEMAALRALLENAGERLLAPRTEVDGASQGSNPTLGAGKSSSFDLPKGPAALAMMRFHLTVAGNGDPARALRSTLLRIKFDGNETVWCPASDFFGSGAGLNPLQNWYRTVSKEGGMTCRWVMPYQTSARITLENLGDEEVTVSLLCVTKPWTWDDRSMHFHTAWHAEAGLDTRPERDWNFIKLTGRGVYVGDTLALFNRVATWYGEGDEKIRVDGDARLRHLGTGTEDYYNYSFAPRGIMQTPFANQVRVDETRTQGHNIMTRSRNLDGIPFRKSLDFDIELISWQPTRLDYAATTHWYAFSGGTSNAKPQVAEAVARIPTLEEAMHPPAFAGVIDAETLEIVEHSPGLITENQDMQVFGFDLWSRGEQLLGRGTKAGDFLVLKIPAPDAAKKRIILQATRANDYAHLSFTVNGTKSLHTFEGYAPSVSPSGDFEIGTFAPVDGHFLIRVEVAGTSPSSVGPRYYFGLDSFRLKAVE